MAKLFGTDGIRGVANKDLTPDLALALGRAVAAVLAPGGGRFVVGRDTRVSGPMLEAALVAGLCSAGADVDIAGIIPTPGVAHLVTEERASGGAMVSASHNPVGDNGIKVFSDDGTKTSADVEAAIEAAMEHPPSDLPTGGDVGRSEILHDGLDRYVTHLLSTIDEPLKGLRVVLDCAYGAAWLAGPRTLREAGADVVALHAEPDGSRINVDCGSTNMSELSKVVVAEGADLGLAFDGDADRVLAVDDAGVAVDGDRILGMVALDLHARDELPHDLVVTTVMANLGFRRALEQRGIEALTTPVGDKYVAEAMTERGAALGGEQSGHIIFASHSTTGDGILTGLQLARIVATSDAPLSQLAHFFEPYPQVLINVAVKDASKLDDASAIWDEVHSAEAELGDEGRVLLRASGTEPLVRVMVEASDPRKAQAVAERLAAAAERALG